MHVVAVIAAVVAVGVAALTWRALRSHGAGTAESANDRPNEVVADLETALEPAGC
jgi:hypothetical protein